MKKLFFSSLFVLCLINFSSNAQAYEEGKSFVSVGYGFGTFWGAVLSDLSQHEGYSTSLTGPIYAKYEYGIGDRFAIGLNLAYVRVAANYQYDGYDYVLFKDVKYTETDTYSSFSGLIRANWHFGDNDKIDPYFGLGLGYRTGNWSHSTNDPEGLADEDFTVPFPFGFETTFGVRVLFTDKIGAYAEAGLAKSAIQIGFTSKF